MTRRVPEPALELLRGAARTWVSPHDRPLTVDELHAAARGAGVIVTLLHHRVDGALLDAAGPSLRVVANVTVPGTTTSTSMRVGARDCPPTNTPASRTRPPTSPSR